MRISYLSSGTASSLDEDLMNPEIGGFSIDQLMELAGLSCAQAVHHFYPPPTAGRRRVLIVCGPGNNGGDGLVCGRHLVHFGYDVTCVYPQEPKKELYSRLHQQLRQLDVPILSAMPPHSELGAFHLVIDAIFGFSFDAHKGIRQPYKDIIQQLVALQSTLPLICIDVPSGWHVSDGDIAHTGLCPALLVSLSAPKECSKKIDVRKTRHVLGGRFITKRLAEKYDLHLPPFHASQQFVDLTQVQTEHPLTDVTASSASLVSAKLEESSAAANVAERKEQHTEAKQRA